MEQKKHSKRRKQNNKTEIICQIISEFKHVRVLGFLPNSIIIKSEDKIYAITESMITCPFSISKNNHPIPSVKISLLEYGEETLNFSRTKEK